MSYKVDPEYAEEVGKYRWYQATRQKNYLMAVVGRKPHRIYLYMHALVWRLAHGRDLPVGLEIDHINHDPSDNRIANLRPATRRLQLLNTRDRDNRSGLPRGVTLKAGRPNPYQARVCDQGRHRSLGCFPTAEEASAVFQKALAEAVALEAEKAMNIWQEAMSDE